MSLALQITFAGSTTLSQVEAVVHKLAKMGLSARYVMEREAPIHRQRPASIESDTVTESLSAKEDSLLEQGLKATHVGGATPLLDAIGRETGKVSQSEEWRKLVSKHPGTYTVREGATILAEMFPNVPYKKWYASAHTMATASQPSCSFRKDNHGRLVPLG